MNPDRWTLVSSLHNAWLNAKPPERIALRAQLDREHPDLAGEVIDLANASAVADGFLETPAFVLTAQELAIAEPELESGTVVGPYRVVSLIANGGMSRVYRATDIRLLRDVALKVLGDAGGSEVRRTERFLQEARVTAALDHPNVVRVYDVGVFRGWPYIVQELLEGETLRDRILRGPVSVADATQMALDVARGLVAAHESGLVHRDLKPENVFLTRQGVTKILDFGIAKLGDDPLPGGMATLPGVLLGTAGYLAPEQVRGERVDARADLFALGSMLFEMLTGRQAFARPHTIDTLHAIVHDDAPTIASLVAEVPASLDAVVRRLLEKTQQRRFQSAVDVVWALEHGVTESVAVNMRPPTRVALRRALSRSPGAAITVAVAAVLAVVGLNAWWLVASRRTSAAEALTQFTWSLPPDQSLASVPAVSPDGRRVLFVAQKTDGTRLVMLRELAALEPQPIAGTDGATQPFWSPDGRAVGFFSRGKLMTVALDGGAPLVLADAPDPRGGTWSPSGLIVYQPDYRDSGLWRVPATGGTAEPVVALDLESDDITLRWPAFLPDGVHFIYARGGRRDAQRGIYVGAANESVATPAHFLFRTEFGAVLAASAVDDQALLISPSGARAEVRTLNLKTLSLVGEARAFDLPASRMSPQHAPLLAMSGDTLALASTPIPVGDHLAFIDRDGSNLRVLPGQSLGGFFRYSPSGEQLARTIVDFRTNDGDVCVEDLIRGTRTRVTASRDLQVLPVWSPDGRRIAYRSGLVRSPYLAVSSADGRGDVTSIACPGSYCEPSDWFPDGQSIAANVDGDVWKVPVTPGAPATPMLAGAFVERDSRLRPDGNWIAYVSYQSGRAEVAVRNTTGAEHHFVVSSGGGDQPVWRHDGGELYYIDATGQLFAVAVDADPINGLRFDAPQKLNVPLFGERHWGTVYDVSPDGRRIVFPHPGEDPPSRTITVMLNWQTLIPGAR